ncbi:hypothetical protein CYMTET_2854 [Cymbomonas tetramitiformis]|uniref:TATA-box binding protein n=1 Tax=Cymbomonas tetramitiformis TaxID=36881 RepID=A0AAE0H4V6_9CHLO|nr:hypothetical protein CYMTET_2854 [Cymbomonas tetramitiformis]
MKSSELDIVHALRMEKNYVCNLVVTACFPAPVDLKLLARVVGATYKPSRFAAVRYRIKHPKCTMLVFKSGKCVCIGCTKLHQAYFAINQCHKDLCTISPNIRISSYRVQNIVTHTNINRQIDILRMSSENGLLTNYDPELFPGLRMSLREQNARASVFFQGNIVVTGCNDFAVLQRTWETVRQRVEPYIINDESDTSPNSRTDAEKASTSKPINRTHNASCMQRQIDRLLYLENVGDVDAEIYQENVFAER